MFDAFSYVGTYTLEIEVRELDHDEAFTLFSQHI
jgi:hypothetical protein